MKVWDRQWKFVFEFTRRNRRIRQRATTRHPSTIYFNGGRDIHRARNVICHIPN